MGGRSMNGVCKAVLFFIVVFFISIPSVFGAGLLIFEQGTKAMGMGGAFTATADDPTANFNNPAGITQLSGKHVTIGNTFARNDQKYDVSSSAGMHHEEMQSKTFFLPHLYLTQEMNDKVTLGFGYNTPFGIGTNWSDSAVGNSVANEAHIKSFDFNPNIAYKINKNLSVALGVHYLRLKTQIIRQVGLTGNPPTFLPPAPVPVASYELAIASGLGEDQFGSFKLDARGGGWAYNLGVLYQINETLKVGFSYRSDMKVEISRNEGTLDFVPNSILSPVRSHTYGKTKIGLPGIFLAGVSTTAIPDWNIAFDLQYTTWNHFDDVVINAKPALNILGTPVSIQILEEDWENTWAFHLGAEYQYTENFAVRAGYFFDKSPMPDRTLGPILPGSDRHNFSLGCGYTKGDWTLDTAYIFSNFENRSTRSNYQNFNASYQTNFHLLGISLTKKL
jgi:long-chain fatty acid transport protein